MTITAPEFESTRRSRPSLAHAIGVGGGNRPRGW